MNSLVWSIILFFFVVVVGTVLFGGWVVFKIVSYILRSLAGNPNHLTQNLPPNTVRCPRGNCLAENTLSSRYCRRCGAKLTVFHQMVA